MPVTLPDLPPVPVRAPDGLRSLRAPLPIGNGRAPSHARQDCIDIKRQDLSARVNITPSLLPR
jgi:hypothetical protein